MTTFFRNPRPPENPEYVKGVKGLSCAACGAPAPSDIHHCKSRPPFDDIDKVYRFFPGYGQTSADEDGIPLCRPCHDMYHRNPAEFHRLYGPDYGFIPTTRAALNYTDMEVDY